MRRLARALLRTFAVACCPLALVAAVFWPISYRYIDFLAVRVAPRHGLAVGDRQGRLYVGVEDFSPGRWVEASRISLASPIGPIDDPPGSRLGFYVELGPEYYAMLPTPVAILALLALAAGAWLLARRLGPPPDPTRCRACGYDLRATPDRCPECGTPATGAA